MTRPIGFSLRVTAICAVALLCACARQPADLLLVNGKVLTVDDRFSIVSTVAVTDGTIVAVGGDDVARQYDSPTTIDLDGAAPPPVALIMSIRYVRRVCASSPAMASAIAIRANMIHTGRRS